MKLKPMEAEHLEGQEFNKHIHLCRITVKWLRHTDLPMQMQPMTSSMVLELCRYILLYTYKYKLYIVKLAVAHFLVYLGGSDVFLT